MNILKILFPKEPVPSNGGISSLSVKKEADDLDLLNTNPDLYENEIKLQLELQKKDPNSYVPPSIFSSTTVDETRYPVGDIGLNIYKEKVFSGRNNSESIFYKDENLEAFRAEVLKKKVKRTRTPKAPIWKRRTIWWIRKGALAEAISRLLRRNNGEQATYTLSEGDIAIRKKAFKGFWFRNWVTYTPDIDRTEAYRKKQYKE